MSALPTVDDVAALAGVSRQTVSNVLNAPDIVRVETRERVRGAIAELGYRPHASARRLRTRTSSTIGVRLDPMNGNGVSGSVLDRFLHELTQRADARGLRILLFTASDAEAEIEQYRRLRDGADVDAVVLTGTSYADPRRAWLVAERMPFVAFGRPWGEGESTATATGPWVDVDGAAGTRAATEHLIGRGLSRIGWLGWPTGSGTGDDRRAGWASAMRANGADAAALERMSHTAEENVAPARQVVERLLAGGAEPDLDALVCASDSLALGAMMAVREAGFPRFPVIGFDNTPVAKAVGLSSVDQRLDLVAASALDLLLGPDGTRVLPQGADGDEPDHRLVAPRLIVRRSSHLAPVEDDPAGGTETGDHDRKEQQ